ncbi:MAG: hypothetical protein Kow0037_30680 [Calditrichia bacterium]
MKLNSESLQDGIEIHTENALQVLLGTDGKGYFYLKRVYPTQRNHMIIKISPEGEIISQKFVKFKNIQGRLFTYKILSNGDIYILNSDKEKYWIEKYPAEWFKE